MSNYPPGVTGNEPHLTGEYPCRVCGGAGYDEDEDGKHSCGWCKGHGVEPEEAEVSQVEWLADNHSVTEAREFVVQCATEWLDRHDEWTRKYLRDLIAVVKRTRGVEQMTFGEELQREATENLHPHGKPVILDKNGCCAICGEYVQVATDDEINRSFDAYR